MGDPPNSPPGGYQSRNVLPTETESRWDRIKKALFAFAVIVAGMAALYVLIAGL